MTPAIDLIPIKSNTKTIQTCFQSCLYVVPGFQRPYSWNTDELDDYWADVVEARGDFFFGSTVTWVSETRELFNDSYSIIDGQQRLTTSAIILSVIRDLFNALASECGSDESLADVQSQAIEQAHNTQRYLVVTDDEGHKYPVVLRDEPNFREVVQEPSAIPSGRSLDGSARQIGVARTYFEDKLKKEVAAETPQQSVDILKTIRGNVLRARLIQVELASEEDGFLVFETLNTRGADLRLADLVKNLLIRGGATDEPNRRTIAERWGRVVDRVQSIAGGATSADQFIWQSWNSRRPAVTEAQLYKQIRTEVETRSGGHLEYLAELEFDAIAYQYLDDVSLIIDERHLESKSALRLEEVGDTLRALALFDVSVANSALLATVRKYEHSNLLGRADLLRVCRLIENFHFQYTALTRGSSTGGTRGRYNRFAVELHQATSSAQVRFVIDGLRDKLVTSLPAAGVAETAFGSLFYAPKVRLTNAQKRRSRKPFMAYVLLRFAQQARTLPAGQNLNTWTIEHIRPQALASGQVADAEHSIGNLTLLTKPGNADVAAGDLQAKREGLRDLVPWLDSPLATWLDDTGKTEVTAMDIQSRTTYLAQRAVATVWAI